MARLKADHCLPRAVDELGRRLQMLEQERGCCVDLDELRGQLPPLAPHVAVHRALADEGRLTVLALLARTPELCACEFQAALGVGHATVSHHMRVLQEAGLVAGERRGRWVHYSLTQAGRDVAP